MAILCIALHLNERRVMQAAQINQYGKPEVVHLNSQAVRPSPAADQVLVAVYAAGVNPFDLTVVEGRAQSMAQLEFPATLGGDVAGIVADIGEAVSGFTVGQPVYGQACPLSGQGSFAEFTPVKAQQLAAKPASLDFTVAAALPLVGSSAYQALVDHLNLQAGHKILIHGGARGIGSLAIQLAKHLGAYVATTAGPAELEFVKKLGADEAIDYSSQDFSQLLHDYDAVYDTVGGETTIKSYAVLKPGGALVSMVAQPDPELVKKHHITFTAQFTQTTTERLTKVAELVEAGALQPQIDRIFPLREAAAALQYLKTGHPKGKVILQVKS